MNKKQEIIRGHIGCTCDEAYKTRGLTDPTCFLCEYESEIELMMDEYLEQQVENLNAPPVSVALPLTEARLCALHDIAKQYCYTTQDNSPTISRKGVELILIEYSKGNER